MGQISISGSTSAEIHDSIRALVVSRKIQPGQSLPPVRELAEMLGVNRNTVAAAYRKLVVAGIALSQGRLGTAIRAQEGPGEQEGATPDSPLIDLGSGNPDPAWLPDANAALADRPFRPRLYGDPPVSPDLAGYARNWLAKDCVGEFEVNLTGGAVDAIERLLMGMLLPGDKVAVEDPCFLSSINVIRICGFEAIGVPVDSEGMSAEHLEEVLLKGAKAVIITPRAHNPTGCSLSEKRATAVRKVLARHPGVLIIEDDHFALLSASPYHTIISPATRHWALVRSVSKVLGPDLRMAFVASDRYVSHRLRLRLAAGTHWVSHLLQDIVLACLTRRDSGKKVAMAREDYLRKRDLMVSALKDEGIDLPAQTDGLNVWVPFEKDSQTMALDLARKGWLVRGGEIFSVGAETRGIRITTSCIDEAQCKRLAADIRRHIT